MNSGPAKRVVVLLALISLLVAVAVASTGSVPVGTGGTRSPSDRFLDVAISLFLLWMAFGTILLLLLIVNRRGVLAQAVVERRKGGRRGALVTGLITFGLLAILIRWISTDGGSGQALLDRFRPGSRRGDLDVSGAAPRYEPEFAVGPVLIVLGVLAVAVTTWAIAYRARRRSLPPMSESLYPALTDVLEETLDDLRAETDPRKAVIGAYARMERTLGAYGLPRLPAEAPDEYLQRIFADLEVSRRSVSRLTALFSWAKFSGQDVATEMKQEAIAALEAVGNELRAAEMLAEERRLTATEALRERAWS
ncbi:DUF4129 domain-containing protein [Gaiella sp.]|uniref:DUF4129 domain-containing protein n=1 Tax=Gaiella sp. TaxID=2663207 RepID=UPI003265715F